jgi:hypothetical protein
MFISKKKGQFSKSSEFFNLENFIYYLEFHQTLYDKLVENDVLPEDDKKFREIIIKNFKLNRIIDLFDVEKPQRGRA